MSSTNNPRELTCKKCGETKELSYFVKDSSKRWGYRQICKLCRNSYLKARYEHKREEIRDYQIAWRSNNSEKVREYNRKTVENYKKTYGTDRFRERARIRYHRNRKNYKKALRESYYRNREKRLEYARIYRKNNKERRRISARFNGFNRRALKIKAKPPWLNSSHMYQIRLMHLLAKKLQEETGVKYSVDHIHPLINPNFCGLHVPWNMQVIPSTENCSKRNKFKPELGLTA